MTLTDEEKIKYFDLIIEQADLQVDTEHPGGDDYKTPYCFNLRFCSTVNNKLFDYCIERKRSTWHRGHKVTNEEIGYKW